MARSNKLDLLVDPAEARPERVLKTDTNYNFLLPSFNDVVAIKLGQGFRILGRFECVVQLRAGVHEARGTSKLSENEAAVAQRYRAQANSQEVAGMQSRPPLNFLEWL